MLLFNLMDISNYVHPRTYFNTSNVTIQLPCINFLLLCQADFNTSNVTIQRVLGVAKHIKSEFQYI